jgi:UDP-N-acetylglucosamine acyltransferase
MIHPTAIVHSGAVIGPDVSLGAFSIIEGRVRIGRGTLIGSHVIIRGDTTLGEDNVIYSFCSLGEPPQDKKYDGAPTRLEIGNRNTIREFCTINLGTAQDAGVTRLGDDNWIMAYVHIAHDCQIGSHTVFANTAQLAGHVHVGDYASLGGHTGVHQFVRIGAYSFIAGGTMLRQDVPPFVMAAGTENVRAYGVNSIGLKRHGFSEAAISEIRVAYKTLYQSGLTFEQAKADIAAQVPACPELKILSDFLESSTRGIVR